MEMGMEMEMGMYFSSSDFNISVLGLSHCYLRKERGPLAGLVSFYILDHKKLDFSHFRVQLLIHKINAQNMTKS